MLVIAMMVALVSVSAFAAPKPPDMPPDLPQDVLRALAEAVDEGRREVFLAALRGAAVEHPDAAPTLAAAGCLLAPWMGELVAGTVLRAVPRPDQAAPVVLAAALVALEGRRGAAVGKAVRRAAPAADMALLEAVEVVFAAALADGTPAAFAAAETHDLPLPLWEVLAEGRAANARSEAWARLWQALPPRPARRRAPGEATGPAEPPAIERQEPVLESRFRVPSGS
ncbi:hypothetical protein ACM64Y_07485 [Novispirillum sp. DQ9]|uniref:hypothetical protein n=1 Tax=Novispirillum sp. DQ9 TaxID=3398612 RepID=UPI003C7D86B3